MRESHSLNFTDLQGTKNTYTDYHLIAKGKPSIDPPEVQTEYVEILGRNGLLDMTGGVDGEVRFKNLTASWSFIVDPRYDYYNVFHRLVNELHGKKFSIVLVDDDPNATYVGRLSISQPSLGEHFNEVTITANIDPNYTRTADNPEKKTWTKPVIVDPVIPPDPIIKTPVDSSKISVEHWSNGDYNGLYPGGIVPSSTDKYLYDGLYSYVAIADWEEPRYVIKVPIPRSETAAWNRSTLSNWRVLTENPKTTNGGINFANVTSILSDSESIFEGDYDTVIAYATYNDGNYPNLVDRRASVKCKK